MVSFKFPLKWLTLKMFHPMSADPAEAHSEVQQLRPAGAFLGDVGQSVPFGKILGWFLIENL